MLEQVEKKWLISQLRGMCISSFKLNKGPIITPNLLFYLELRFLWTKFYRFVEYTPVKRPNNFVQSLANARRQVEYNPNTSVVAGTMKLLAKCSYDYQIMHCNPHTFTRYTIGEKTLAAINKSMFKRLGHISDQLYEVQLAKSEIEHKEQMIVGFINLQFAKLRSLELHDKLAPKFSIMISLSRSRKKVFDCTRSKRMQEWEFLRSKDCKDSSTADACSKFLPPTYKKKLHKREPGLFKEEFRSALLLCLFNKTYCSYNSLGNKNMPSCKGLNKRTFENSGDEPMAKYRKLLDETDNLISTNRGFHTKNHCAGSYEETKKELLFSS